MVALMALLTLLLLGWAAYTVQNRLIQSSGHSLVQAATDAASKLDTMVLERYRDIQLLSTAPLTLNQNPEALTTYLRGMALAHPAYQWIGVTDSHGKIIAATDATQISLDRRQSRWFQLAQTIDHVGILDAQVQDESGGTSAFTVFAPLRSPDGEFLGAVAAVVGIPPLRHILDDTMHVLKNIEWTDASHLEYRLLNEKGDSIVDSTLRENGQLNVKQPESPSATMLRKQQQGFIQETDHRRGTPIVTAYAQVNIAHADPPLHWGILIHVDKDSILIPIHSFLRELSVLVILILLPLFGLVLGMLKALYGEWAITKREFHRVTEAKAALRKRTEALDTLVVAAQTLSVQQDIDGLLHHLLQLAKNNSGARYAALDVYHDNTRKATRFLAAGSDDQAAQAIQTVLLKQTAGESLGHESGLIRLAHLREHWTALGIPPDHASLTSFLSVAIRYQDQFFGRLFLANKVNAQGLANCFSELDEQAILTLAVQAGTAIQNLQLLQDSKEQARHDSLTELLNHSATLTILAQELSRAQRTHTPVAVLIADLDHFKKVNDTYGHPVGDLVLRETARRLRETARRSDHVGRVGGEEFLIVAPECDLNALQECAERFRVAISDKPFETTSGPLTITVSIGATIWSSEHPLNSERLRKMADYALYRVKSRGRNGIDIVPHPNTSEADLMGKAV
ncbi:MAG: diguanylate cyclase [Nitrospiraceae bacterium]|nr:diguanylate cyclase [Nitrospiraceae bacterium]